jgi:uncharacterized phage-associated protein
MANIFDVAEFFVDAAGEESDMTNLKLNKLLYFAQGVHLARTGTPLFEDTIVAWEFGPAIPCVHQRYSKCGKNPIEPDKIDLEGRLSDEETATIIDTMREFGKYTAYYLVTKTHAAGTPWAMTPRGDIISQAVIKDYFEKNETTAPFVFTPPPDAVFSGKRDPDGVLVFSAEDRADWGEWEDV